MDAPRLVPSKTLGSNPNISPGNREMKSAQPCCPSLSGCLTSTREGDCADAKLYRGTRSVWSAGTTPHRGWFRRRRGELRCGVAAVAAGRTQVGTAEIG